MKEKKILNFKIINQAFPKTTLGVPQTTRNKKQNPNKQKKFSVAVALLILSTQIQDQEGGKKTSWESGRGFERNRVPLLATVS